MVRRGADTTLHKETWGDNWSLPNAGSQNPNCSLWESNLFPDPFKYRQYQLDAVPSRRSCLIPGILTPRPGPRAKRSPGSSVLREYVTLLPTDGDTEPKPTCLLNFSNNVIQDDRKYANASRRYGQ